MSDEETDEPEYEWIEWTDAELDEVPVERWEFECRGQGKRFQKHTFSFDKGNQYSTHKTFKLGKLTVEREGHVIIEPRFTDVMHVDPERATITFTCKRPDCAMRFEIKIEKIVIMLSQTMDRCGREVGVQYGEPGWPEGSEYRPMRLPRQIVDVADTLASSHVVSEGDGEWWQEKYAYFLAEYKKRPRTVTVKTRNGDRITLP